MQHNWGPLPAPPPRPPRPCRKRRLLAVRKGHVKPCVRVVEAGNVHGVARDGRAVFVGVVKHIVDLQPGAVRKPERLQVHGDLGDHAIRKDG